MATLPSKTEEILFDPAALTTAEVDVRVVIFTVDDGRLMLALQDDGLLPRRQIKSPENLDSVAQQAILQVVGNREQYLEQLYTLSDPEVAPWGIVVSYIALLNPAHVPANLIKARWHAAEPLSAASASDRLIVDYALVRLRAKLGYTNIAFHLLPEQFVLSELQRVYESILDRTLDKRNFRRRLATSGILQNTGQVRREGSHRPAQLYRFHSKPDRESYLTPPWTGSGREGTENVPQVGLEPFE